MVIIKATEIREIQSDGFLNLFVAVSKDTAMTGCTIKEPWRINTLHENFKSWMSRNREKLNLISKFSGSAIRFSVIKNISPRSDK